MINLLHNYSLQPEAVAVVAVVAVVPEAAGPLGVVQEQEQEVQQVAEQVQVLVQVAVVLRLQAEETLVALTPVEM